MSDQPARIDRYEIQEIIGRGAMGVVYRALDPVIGRVVALKTISLHDGISSRMREDSLARFAREARAAGLLSHPNIVTVYDVGEIAEGPTSYIAMEFVEGRTLRQMVPHGERMTPEEVLDLALQVARGLDYAHRRGVVHRDIKPANILVREDGLVKLVDFGVARIESSDLTRTGQSVGSPSYIAPEMLLAKPVDGRADLFSLGVILYELLTGEKPFRGETIAALYHQIIAARPATPSTRNPALSPEWSAVVMKLLAKEPQERYGSAGQLIDDLRRFELSRPLKFATAPGEPSAGALELEGPEEVPEVVLERVIEQGSREGEGASRAFPPQARALLALLLVAGLALAAIVAIAFLRDSMGPAAPSADPAGAAVVIPVELTVRLAHNLRSGWLTVSLDGQQVLAEPFRGERARMRMQGTLSHRLQVPPGKHLFKITVQDEGGASWSQIATREMREGSRSTLAVELKGVVKKSLDLTWR